MNQKVEPVAMGYFDYAVTVPSRAPVPLFRSWMRRLPFPAQRLPY